MTTDLAAWLQHCMAAEADTALARLADDPRFLHGTGATRPLILWAAFDLNRAGWCVWKAAKGDLIAQFHAGPFDTREQAEALLGPPAAATGRITP